MPSQAFCLFPCENNHMFTRSSPAWGASSPSIAWAALHHGSRLTIRNPCGCLEDVGLGDSIALNGATATSLDPANHRFTIDISAESLDKTCGLAETGIITWKKACAPMTGSAATSCPAMSTGLATSHFSGGRELRIRAPVAGRTWPTKAPSPSMA
jgi:hypothetical protein